jgi:hypothetical protein
MTVTRIVLAALVLGSGPDPAALNRKIEGDLLLRPSLVSLDFQERPMSEVIKEVTARTGSRLVIHEAELGWLAQRITLHAPAPVPFWNAVDRICAAGRFQYNLSGDSGGPCVAIFRDDVSGPASDHGPVRCQIEEIFYDNRYIQLHLGRSRTSRPTLSGEHEGKSDISLRIMVEPRMMIRHNGPLKNLSAVDEQGRSLLLDEPEAAGPAGGSWPWENDLRMGYVYVTRRVALRPLEPRPRMIRTLRGVAPVVYAACWPDTLEIPLADAAGRSFRSRTSVVTFRQVRKFAPDAIPFPPGAGMPRLTPTPTAQIELTIRPLDQPASADPAAPLQEPPDVSARQFALVDPAGPKWSISITGPPGANPHREGGEIHVVLSPVGGPGRQGPVTLWLWPPKLAGVVLRYRDLAVQKAEIPFEFTDVPLP